MDPSQLSNEDLIAIAGSPTSNSLSNEDLIKIAGPPMGSDTGAGNWADSLNSVSQSALDHLGWAKQLESGVVEGVGNLAGMASDLNPLNPNWDTYNAIADKLKSKITGSAFTPSPNSEPFPALRAVTGLEEKNLPAPTQDFAGRYLRTIGQFAAPALIPGGQLMPAVTGAIATQGAKDAGLGPWAQFGASILGAGAPSVFSAGSRAMIGPQTERGARELVGNALSKYDIAPEDVSSALAQNSSDPLLNSKTSAELLQSPELATLEQSMATGPRATEYGAAKLARSTAQQDLLDTVSTAKNVPTEATGQTIQENWNTAQRAEKESIRSLYAAVPKDVTPDTSDLKNTITEAANKYYGPGSPDVPSGIKGRIKFLNSGERQIEESSTSPVLDYLGRPIQNVTSSTEGEAVTIEGMQNARSHLGDMERAAIRAGNNQEAALAGTIKKGIANAIDNAPAGSEEWRTANAAYQNYANRFLNGPLSKIQDALPSTVYNKILKNPEAAVQAADILKKSPQAMGAIKDQIASDLSDMTEAAQAKFISNNESELKTLLGKDFDSLNAIRNDIRSRIDTQTLANPTRGSNTALKLSNVVQRAITGKDGTTNSGAWSTLLKGAGIGGSVAALSHPAIGIPLAIGGLGLNALKNRSSALVQDTLYNALMHPEELGSALKAAGRSGGSLSAFAKTIPVAASSVFSGGKSMLPVAPTPPALPASTYQAQERDLTNQFNTPLSAQEKVSFEQWRSSLPKRLQSSYDYDLQGFFKENGPISFSGETHMPDTFKKPNHETFSIESKYSDSTHQGGKWIGPNHDQYVPPISPVLDAVKRVESGGNSKAISTKGAKGPYQLMDATGKEYHDKLGIKDAYDPFNERQARTIAEAILMHNLDVFDGNLSDALTAYNSGEGNVKSGKLGPQGRAYSSKVFAELTGNG